MPMEYYITSIRPAVFSPCVWLGLINNMLLMTGVRIMVNLPIIFYKYNPKYKPVPYRDWVDQAVVLNDYDEAYAYRDRSMK